MLARTSEWAGLCKESLNSVFSTLSGLAVLVLKVLLIILIFLSLNQKQILLHKKLLIELNIQNKLNF